MNFFPCFLDIDRHLPTVAFGYSNVTASKYDLIQYGKTTKLAEIFTEDKLLELFDLYFQNYYFIKQFLNWSKWFIYDKNPNNRPYSKETDEEMVLKWNQNVFQLYEKYRISVSVFDRLLYAQLLNDHLWNPKFDPRNPKIQDYNKQRMQKIIKRYTPLVESAHSGTFYHATDSDSIKLVSLKLEANLIEIYNNISLTLRDFKESNNIDGLKLESSKLQFMNNLIESNYIFSDFPSDRDLYSKYSSLRKSIQKSLTESLNHIMLNENSFDFNLYYECTTFYSIDNTVHRQLMHYKEFIRECF